MALKTFTDTEEHKWEIKLTIASAKRVRDLLGVNLLELEVGDPPLITRLAIDYLLLCDVIFVLVKPQADTAGITDVQFGQALGGDALQKAQIAFYEELISFFRQLGRKDLAQAIKKQGEMLALAVERASLKIDAIDQKRVVDETLGDLSTKSPALPE